mmetsp:Transcript_24817/g.74641  ORF Transcript_24817/g.74641 Transcript_24817/m.74641 type:complete len:2245 (-) Transcript_24817:162-6896(-)
MSADSAGSRDGGPAVSSAKMQEVKYVVTDGDRQPLLPPLPEAQPGATATLVSRSIGEGDDHSESSDTDVSELDCSDGNPTGDELRDDEMRRLGLASVLGSPRRVPDMLPVFFPPSSRASLDGMHVRGRALSVAAAATAAADRAEDSHAMEEANEADDDGSPSESSGGELVGQVTPRGDEETSERMLSVDYALLSTFGPGVLPTASSVGSVPDARNGDRTQAPPPGSMPVSRANEKGEASASCEVPRHSDARLALLFHTAQSPTHGNIAYGPASGEGEPAAAASASAAASEAPPRSTPPRVAGEGTELIQNMGLDPAWIQDAFYDVQECSDGSEISLQGIAKWSGVAPDLVWKAFTKLPSRGRTNVAGGMAAEAAPPSVSPESLTPTMSRKTKFRHSMMPGIGRKWAGSRASVGRGGLQQAGSPPLKVESPNAPPFDNPPLDLIEFAIIVDMLLKLPVLEDTILGMNTQNMPFTSVVDKAQYEILNACWQRADAAHGFIHDLYNLHDETKNNAIVDVVTLGLDESAMRMPLSNYFIRCSHNTYLPGAQVAAVTHRQGPGVKSSNTASEECYRLALQKGARSVEVDTYGKRSVAIKHGNFSGTGSLPLEAVLETIKDAAFKASAYPVIVSVEQHCHRSGQRRMARAIREHWGQSPTHPNYLASNRKSTASSLQRSRNFFGRDTSQIDTDLQQFASPHDLRFKIIVKHKWRGKNGRRYHEELVSLSANGRALKVKIGDMAKATTAKGPPVISSVSDTRAVHHIKSARHRQVWRQFNKRHITRVYPHRTKIASENFDPQRLWNVGVQMVALNMQTPGLATYLDHGFFQQNGGTGFVPKPAVHTNEGCRFDAWVPDTFCKPIGETVVLTVRILGARFLRVQTKEKRHPRGRITVPRDTSATSDSAATVAETTRFGDVLYKPAQRPTVEVLVCGVPADQHIPYITNPSNDPGFSATWDNETFIQEVTCPELASLGFVVRESGQSGRQDDYLNICGQFFVPVSCLRTGYRAVQLLNQINEPIRGSSLLVHIDLQPQAALLPVFRSQLEVAGSKGLRAVLLEEGIDTVPAGKRSRRKSHRSKWKVHTTRPVLVSAVLGERQSEHTIYCTPTSDSTSPVTIFLNNIRSVCCSATACEGFNTPHAAHGCMTAEDPDRDQSILYGQAIYLNFRVSMEPRGRGSASNSTGAMRGFAFTTRAKACAFLKFVIDNHENRDNVVCEPLKRFILDYNWAGRDTGIIDTSRIDAAGAEDIAIHLRKIYRDKYNTLKLPTFGDARNGQATFPILTAHLRIARRLFLTRSLSGSRPSRVGIHSNELVEVVSDDSFVFSSTNNGALVLAPAGAGKSTMAHYLLAAWAAKEFWSDRSSFHFQLVFFIPLDRLPTADFRDLSDLIHCLYFSNDLTITPSGLRALLKHAASSILLIFDSVDAHQWGRYPRIDDVILGEGEYSPMCIFFSRENVGDSDFECMLTKWQNNLYAIPPLDALNLERSILPIWNASHENTDKVMLQAHAIASHIKNHATLQQFMQDPGMLGLLTGIVCDYPNLFRRGNTYMGHAVMFEKITDMLIERNASSSKAFQSNEVMPIRLHVRTTGDEPARHNLDTAVQQPSGRYDDRTALSASEWSAIESDLKPLSEMAYYAFQRGFKYLRVPSEFEACVAVATRIGLLWRDTIIAFDGSRKILHYKYHFCCASMGVYFAARYVAEHVDALKDLLATLTPVDDAPHAPRRRNRLDNGSPARRSSSTTSLDSPDPAAYVAQTNLLVLDDSKYHGLLRFTVGIMACKQHSAEEEVLSRTPSRESRRKSYVRDAPSRDQPLSDEGIAALGDAQILVIQTIADNCTREYNSYLGEGKYKKEVGVEPALFALCLGCIYEMYTSAGRRCLYGTLRPSRSLQGLLGRAGEAASRVLREKLSLNGMGGQKHLSVRDLSAIASGLSFLGVLSSFHSVSLATLTDIDVGNNNIGKSGCRILADGLKKNRSVQMLNVSDNNIGKDGAAALATILAGDDRCEIKQVRAHGNELGDLGALEFAKVIAAADCILTYLGIMRNEIGDYGANQLFDSAFRSSTLEQLGLMDNRIGDSGAHAAGRLLKSPSCALTHLALGRNRITADGIRSISDGLAENLSLRSCLMLGNVNAEELAALKVSAPLDGRLDFEHNFFKVTRRETATQQDLHAVHKARSLPGKLTVPNKGRWMASPLSKFGTVSEAAAAAADESNGTAVIGSRSVATAGSRGAGHKSAESKSHTGPGAASANTVV